MSEINDPVFRSTRKGVTASGQPSQTYLSMLSHFGKGTTGNAPIDDIENRKPVCELVRKMRGELIL